MFTLTKQIITSDFVTLLIGKKVSMSPGKIILHGRHVSK